MYSSPKSVVRTRRTCGANPVWGCRPRGAHHTTYLGLLYDIEFSTEAIEDLKSFRKFEQDVQIVSIEVIGFKKGNQLFVRFVRGTRRFL
jgi:hypothetical protein